MSIAYEVMQGMAICGVLILALAIMLTQRRTNHRCLVCKRWVLFPVLHFIIHSLDSVRKETKRRNELEK